MTKRTKKVGITGRFGARYGVKPRNQLAAIMTAKARAYECPNCKHVAVRRVASGIWRCRKCDLTFAGGAYTPGSMVVGTPTAEALIESLEPKKEAEGAAAAPKEKEE
jgi:large subunit ribosomal protein L37Ae